MSKLMYNINGVDKMIKRTNTKKVFINNLQIGGQDKVVIQSMCNTRTSDVEATVKQINALTKRGCELVRVAVLDMEDAKAIKEIKKKILIPLVADIHFDYKLALAVLKMVLIRLELILEILDLLKKLKRLLKNVRNLKYQ